MFTNFQRKDKSPLIIENIKRYLKDKEVKFAYLCGSYGRKRIRKTSDVDLAIYFEKVPSFKEKMNICIHIERMIKKEVDLIVLNTSPAWLAFSCVNYGLPILIKDEGFFIEWWLEASSEAMDFYEFLNDFLRLKKYAESQ